MNKNSKQLLSKMFLNKGLSQEEIEIFIKAIKYDLPEDYLDFLNYSNGASEFVGDGNYVDLWSVEEIQTENKLLEISEYAPGLIAFGSDGGNEIYAFDTRNSKTPIVQIPLIGMSLDAVVFFANDFDEFLEKLASTE